MAHSWYFTFDIFASRIVIINEKMLQLRVFSIVFEKKGNGMLFKADVIKCMKSQ